VAEKQREVQPRAGPELVWRQCEKSAGRVSEGQFKLRHLWPGANPASNVGGTISVTFGSQVS